MIDVNVIARMMLQRKNDVAKKMKSFLGTILTNKF